MLEWAAARLHVLGTPATGAAEPVKDRPWSTVHRVPVRGGVVWVKACGGRTRYEAPLTVALAGWVPDLVLRPLATDDERGWLLLPDGGVPRCKTCSRVPTGDARCGGPERGRQRPRIRSPP